MRKLKWYKSLQNSKGRSKFGYFLIEGERSLSLILRNKPQYVDEILIRADSVNDYHLYEKYRILDNNQFNSICTSKNPQGILAVVSLPSKVSDSTIYQNSKSILYLDDVQDPGNVGTLIRTASAFGFDGIILTNKCADPYSPKSIASSAGSIFSLWIQRSESAFKMLKKCKDSGFKIISSDVHGDNKKLNISHKDKFVLVLGSEGNGVSKNVLSLSDHRFFIPIDTQKAESLNVASAGAVCMYMLKDY